MGLTPDSKAAATDPNIDGMTVMAERHAADRPDGFWTAVGADYIGDELTIKEILAKYEITQGEFNAAKKRFGWPRRKTTARTVTRKQIISRLFRLVDGMAQRLEDNMSKAGDAEVTILGRLVQSMGKLIEIEAAAGADAPPRQTKDMQDIRSKLVARIEELKRA